MQHPPTRLELLADFHSVGGLKRTSVDRSMAVEGPSAATRATAARAESDTSSLVMESSEGEVGVQTFVEKGP